MKFQGFDFRFGDSAWWRHWGCTSRPACECGRYAAAFAVYLGPLGLFWFNDRPDLSRRPHIGHAARVTITTQATGKWPKALQAVGVIVLLGSLVACVSGDPTAFAVGVLGVIAGPALYVVGRVSAWWWYG